MENPENLKGDLGGWPNSPVVLAEKPFVRFAFFAVKHSNLKTSTPTLGVIYGNRDFFPDRLVTEARADIAKLFAQLGIKVIGGTSLAGGRGSIFGTVHGCLIIGVLNNGRFLLDVSPFWQPVVKGFVILATVAADKMGAQRE